MPSDLSPDDFATDKHGYVLFDCATCQRRAKLQLVTIRAHIQAQGAAGILRMVAPNDCRALPCGFRFRP